MEVALLKCHPFIRKHELVTASEPTVAAELNSSIVTNVNSFIMAAKANLMAKEISRGFEHLSTEPKLDKKDSSTPTPKSPLAMFKQRSSPIVMNRPFNPATGQITPLGFGKFSNHLQAPTQHMFPEPSPDPSTPMKNESNLTSTFGHAMRTDTAKLLRNIEAQGGQSVDTPRLPSLPIPAVPDRQLITPSESDEGSIACSEDLLEQQERLLREMMGQTQDDDMPIHKPHLNGPLRSETFASGHTFGGVTAGKGGKEKEREREMGEEEMLREQEKLLREMMGIDSPREEGNGGNGQKGQEVDEPEMDEEELLREQERLLAEMMGGPEVPTQTIPNQAQKTQKESEPSEEMDIDELMKEQERLLAEMMSPKIETKTQNEVPLEPSQSEDMDAEELMREQEKLLMEMMNTNEKEPVSTPASKPKSASLDDYDLLLQEQERLLAEMMGEPTKPTTTIPTQNHEISEHSLASASTPSVKRSAVKEIPLNFKAGASTKVFKEDEAKDVIIQREAIAKITTHLKDQMMSEDSEEQYSSPEKKQKKPKFDPVPLAQMTKLPTTQMAANTSKILSHTIADQIISAQQQAAQKHQNMFLTEGTLIQTQPSVLRDSPESSAFTSPQKGRGKVPIKSGSQFKKGTAQLKPLPEEKDQIPAPIHQGEMSTRSKPKMYYNPVEITPDQLTGPIQPGWDTLLPMQKKQLSLKALAVEEKHRKEEERKQNDTYRGPFLDGYQEPTRPAKQGKKPKKEINLESKLRAQQHDHNAHPYSDQEDSSRSPSPTSQKMKGGDSGLFFPGSRTQGGSKPSLH